MSQKNLLMMSLWIVGEFRQFVEAIGYKTIAELPLLKEQFPNLSEEQRQPGSLVFQPLSDAYPAW